MKVIAEKLNLLVIGENYDILTQYQSANKLIDIHYSDLLSLNEAESKYDILLLISKNDDINFLNNTYSYIKTITGIPIFLFLDKSIDTKDTYLVYSNIIDIGFEDIFFNVSPFDEILNRIYTYNKKNNEYKSSYYKLSQKDKFISMIAHDIRGPLSGVYSLLNEMLEIYDELDKSDVKSSLTNISESIKLQLNLLEDLLIWGRVSIKKEIHNKEYFKPEDLLKRSIELFSLNAKNKSLSVELISKSEESIYSDRNDLYIAFNNLLSNAIKFSNDNNKIEIYINELENDYLEIKFVDYGIGIDKDKLKGLFDLFVLSSSSGTHGEKGTGLGLLITKDLIERNNGSLEIESEISIGTKISIIIPKVSERGL